jgi:hypothetical protein
LIDWHQDAEILEAATTSLRALTTRLAEESCGEHLVSSMTAIDLEAFCNLADKCEDLSVRVNVYRVVASLAAIVSVNFNEQTAPLLVVSIFIFFLYCLCFILLSLIKKHCYSINIF